MIKAVFFDFYGVININSKLNREIAEFIQLNNNKYLFAVLSAAQGDLHDWLITHGINDYFALVQTTSKVGIEKSDQRFYQLAIRLLELQPQEVVFIDDAREYTQIARGVGMHTINYKSDMNFSQQVKGLIV